MKTCIRCHKEKPEFDFGKSSMRKSGLLSVDKEATEAAVAAQIEAQKNPVTATGLPWSA